MFLIVIPCGRMLAGAESELRVGGGLSGPAGGEQSIEEWESSMPDCKGDVRAMPFATWWHTVSKWYSVPEMLFHDISNTEIFLEKKKSCETHGKRKVF